MKVLGTVQFQQKKFKLLPITGKFKATLGDIPQAFMMIIYGNSGNGKTEFCIQLAKDLTKHGNVAWLSYEQGHGFDLQTAINRNKMEEVSGKFFIIDPVANKPRNMTFLEDLDGYLSKRNSPEFIFIDSVDYTRFTFEEYEFLKTKYGHKKTFIWISHANGNKPQKRVGVQIEYDGGIGIYINKFIAEVKKNRFGGFTDYIIYEDRARELNPLYFKVKHQEAPAEPVAKVPKTKKKLENNPVEAENEQDEPAET